MIHIRDISIAISIFTSSLWEIAPEWSFPERTTLNCLRNPSIAKLEQLIDCLETYTVPHNFYDRISYGDAQPTLEERQAWSNVTASLLMVDYNCSSITLPQAIVDMYSVSLYTETTGASYCVLSEARIRNGVYMKGWGLLIVPDSTKAVHRHLHISAPHPVWDSRTPTQAVALFKSTGAKSLFIPGRIRTAFMDPTDCVKGNSGQGVYLRTDPTHDTSELFFETKKVIRAWQAKNGGCAASTCAYIQFHGKSTRTCSSDQIFLSSGIGRDPPSIDWYTNDVQRPIKRLKSQLQFEFPDWNISLPSDSQCSLTATKNVVGRFLNGVDEAKVCEEASTADLVTGTFIHIEQAAVSRDEKAYSGWSKALVKTFSDINT